MSQEQEKLNWKEELQTCEHVLARRQLYLTKKVQEFLESMKKLSSGSMEERKAAAAQLCEVQRGFLVEALSVEQAFDYVEEAWVHVQKGD